MTTWRTVEHVQTGRVLVARARWCDRFWSRMRGFMGRRSLSPGEGLVLVEARESRATSAITMLFVFCDLGVIWVNDAGLVVATTVARPWRLSYAPPAPARYVVETEPAVLNRVAPGDTLRFLPVEP